MMYSFFFFFFNDTATTEIYTLSLHDALPISCFRCIFKQPPPPGTVASCQEAGVIGALAGEIGTIQATEVLKLILGDRKSTRLNSSHGYISYAVFCLKKKKITLITCARPLQTY